MIYGEEVCEKQVREFLKKLPDLSGVLGMTLDRFIEEEPLESVLLSCEIQGALEETYRLTIAPYPHDVIESFYVPETDEKAIGVIGIRLGRFSQGMKPEVLSKAAEKAEKVEVEELTESIEALVGKVPENLGRWSHRDKGVVIRTIPLDCHCCS